jgi:hypothetical protein
VSNESHQLLSVKSHSHDDIQPQPFGAVAKIGKTHAWSTTGFSIVSAGMPAG